ncbi:hypothetical protein EVJ58_g5158 [Rhodofomes roseus]|uniref:Uncharacterized protein n=1 Tax=Rhodofomes roseus TaxID=34475 RepID=A0A4Y9YG61_9APHY|nr:hypothetical protein EVJ58_g5158 [Rhodofomes roseus]
MVPKLISVDKNPDKWRRIYHLQLAVRLVFALVGPGYIHPDEHYQNAEVIAGQHTDVAVLLNHYRAS